MVLSDFLLEAVDEMMAARGEGKFKSSKSSRLCVLERQYATTTIVFLRSKKVKVTAVRSLIARIEGKIIFVGKGQPTSFSKKEIAEAGAQYFTVAELSRPVIRHPLVPHHAKVDTPPRGIRKEDLPILSLSDPVCKYYCFKAGDVIEIQRKGYKYYRVVL